jgi:membrane-associated phospholipid phosphatase
LSRRFADMLESPLSKAKGIGTFALSGGFGFRKPEAIELLFFFYLAALALVLRNRPRADLRVLLLAIGVTIAVLLLVWAEQKWRPTTFSIVRDWFILGLVLVYYRALDWFAPASYNVALEASWLQWDHVMLSHYGLRHLIESFGKLIPAYLELCYLLTSQAGCYALAIIYLYRQRERSDRFLSIYVLGTLISYALIPYFPTRPPRVVFPFYDAPTVNTALRTVNLSLLSAAGIHAGVFPSAHVSSTFSAAWGLFAALPEHKIYGYIFLGYAISVAIATVYGRYHYAVDAVAGIAMSLIALLLVRLPHFRRTFRSA